MASLSNTQTREMWKQLAVNLLGKSSDGLTARIDLDADVFSIQNKDMTTFDDIKTVRKQKGG
ncbi:hypothetical protein CA13_16610 [Planctomycetes bacterium CA13]|uniref:Uncharacterized protein n=1 Tax=Novipirellula herctigrandis TaxID=2527986 RepID=A0A5C5YYS1_9BACT|nr:hypothetical protein CA13_16610 [Planctomycetes bacterium CA13]